MCGCAVGWSSDLVLLSINAYPWQPKRNMWFGIGVCLFHNIAGSFPVVACGMMLYFYVTSRAAYDQYLSSKLECARAYRTASMIVLMNRSTIEFSWGWWSVIDSCMTLTDLSFAISHVDKKSLALSQCRILMFLFSLFLMWIIIFCTAVCACALVIKETTNVYRDARSINLRTC